MGSGELRLGCVLSAMDGVTHAHTRARTHTRRGRQRQTGRHRDRERKTKGIEEVFINGAPQSSGIK